MRYPRVVEVPVEEIEIGQTNVVVMGRDGKCVGVYLEEGMGGEHVVPKLNTRCSEVRRVGVIVRSYLRVETIDIHADPAKDGDA